MAVNDSIEQNGTYTLSNLKDATGINDNRLSAHHQNGPGVQTSFKDFVCKGLGRATGQDGVNDTDPATWSPYLYPHAIYKPSGTQQNEAGSYDSNDWYVFNDDDVILTADGAGSNIVIEIEIFSGSDGYPQWPHQIGTVNSGIQVNTDSILDLVDRRVVNVSGDDILRYEFNTVGYGGATIIGFTWKDSLNLNGTNYGGGTLGPNSNSGMVFRTEEVQDAAPLIETFYVEITKIDSTTFGFDFNYDNSASSPYAEGAVVYDPEDKIDAQFYMYQDDPANNSPYANKTDPDFQDENNQFNQQVQDFATSPNGNREKNFWCEIEDQNGNIKDVVHMPINEDGVDNFPSTVGNTECYQMTSTRARDPRTSLSNPYTMSQQDDTC